MPAWRYGSLTDILDEINLGDAARTLRMDVKEDEENMLDYITDAAAVEARKLARAA